MTVTHEVHAEVDGVDLDIIVKGSTEGDPKIVTEVVRVIAENIEKAVINIEDS